MSDTECPIELRQIGNGSDVYVSVSSRKNSMMELASDDGPCADKDRSHIISGTEALWFAPGGRYRLGAREGVGALFANIDTSYVPPDLDPTGSVFAADSSGDDEIGNLLATDEFSVFPYCQESHEAWILKSVVNKLRQRNKLLTKLEALRNSGSQEAEKTEKALTKIRRNLQRNGLVVNKVDFAHGQFANRRTQQAFIERLITTIEKDDIPGIAICMAGISLEDVELRYIDFLRMLVIDPESELKYSILHIALLFGSPQMVQLILAHDEELANVKGSAVYCTDLWPLHIALESGNLSNVHSLMEVLPENERELHINRIIENTEVQGKANTGLALAVLVWASIDSNPDTVTNAIMHLVNNGADLALEDDVNGNTFLHLLVWQACDIQTKEDLQYFKVILKRAFFDAVDIWYKTRADLISLEQGIQYLLSLKNKKGFTPTALAAKLESSLYTELVNWENVTWFPLRIVSKRSRTAGYYAINEMMCFTEEGFYNPRSVTHILCHMNCDLNRVHYHSDIFSTEPLQSLIRLKWKFYQWIYLIWGLLHLAHMTAFTYTTLHSMPVAVTVLPNASVPSALADNGSATLNLIDSNGGESHEVSANKLLMLFLMWPIVNIFFEIVDIRTTYLGHKVFRERLNLLSKQWCALLFFKIKYMLTGGFTLLSNGIYRTVAFIFSILTIIWVACQMTAVDDNAILLSILLLFGWFFMLFFTRSMKFPGKTGYFSIMVQKMLREDFIPFGIVSAVFLIAFSSAVHATILNSEKDNAMPHHQHFEYTIFEMVKYFAAMDNSQGYEASHSPHIAKLMLCLFGLFSAVLLINVLIAAMNKTYSTVIDTHIDLVAQQQLSIFLLIERRLPFKSIRNWTEKDFLYKEPNDVFLCTSVK